jgi:hypothetical protein
MGHAESDSDAVLFINGLRMDLAHRLAALLEVAGANVNLGWRWAGSPTVTATCKPLASPAAKRLRGGESTETFEPQSADGRRVVQMVLLNELAALGWRNGMTLIAAERCWMEAGHFDKDGHGQQSLMADHVNAGLSALAAEALRLVQSGTTIAHYNGPRVVAAAGRMPECLLGGTTARLRIELRS